MFDGTVDFVGGDAGGSMYSAYAPAVDNLLSQASPTGKNQRAMDWISTSDAVAGSDLLIGPSTYPLVKDQFEFRPMEMFYDPEADLMTEVYQLLDTTEQSLYEGISKMWAGNRVGDVASAIQQYVEKRGYLLTRVYTGHGVGRKMHEGPQVPNYGTPGRGLVLRPGMTIAIEPMVLVGTDKTRVLPDRWTVVSADGSLTAHFEHTVAVTEGEPSILTLA